MAHENGPSTLLVIDEARLRKLDPAHQPGFSSPTSAGEENDNSVDGPAKPGHDV
ncbi:MAG: hypothetical protein HXY22_12650 [Alphaproteobacteria bacterium]|nr:hypothetical protein [Alphaproteobacteria bacterium]